MADQALLEKYVGLPARLDEFRLAAVGAAQSERTDHDGAADPEAVRSRCDDLWHRWLTLPEVDVAERAVRKLSEIHAVIAPTGKSPLQGDLDDLDGLLRRHNITGGLFTPFRQRFLNRIDDVIGGITSLLVRIGGVATAELGIWSEAQCSVVQLFEAGLSQLAAVQARTGAGDWAVTVRIQGWADAGAAAFLSGTDDAQVAVTAPARPAASYDGVMTALETALAQLEDAVAAELSAMARTCRDVAGIGDAGAGIRHRYDLEGGLGLLEITDGDQLADGINFRLGDASPLWTTILPGIGEHLHGAYREIIFAYYPYAGFYWSGERLAGSMTTLDAYKGATDLLMELLGDLRQEVFDAADTLQAGVRDFEQQDDATQQALDRIRQRIESHHH